MFKITVACLITFLSSISFSNFTTKECGTALTVARTGVLTLTQGEPTDVRELPAAALLKVVQSLKDYWIQVSTREPISTFGNAEGVNHYLLKVMGTSQGLRFGQSMTTLIGAVAESIHPTNFKNEITVIQEKANGAKNYITTEIFLGDITSVQLVDDVPEITISLFNQMKFDRKNINPQRFDEKILGLTADNSEATTIVAELADATFPKIHGKDVDFEAFVNVLDQQNIRGRDLVVAFRDFAEGNIEGLIIGVLERPEEVAKVINKNSPSNPVSAHPANYKTLN